MYNKSIEKQMYKWARDTYTHHMQIDSTRFSYEFHNAYNILFDQVIFSFR